MKSDKMLITNTRYSFFKTYFFLNECLISIRYNRKWTKNQVSTINIHLALPHDMYFAVNTINALLEFLFTCLKSALLACLWATAHSLPSVQIFNISLCIPPNPQPLGHNFYLFLDFELRKYRLSKHSLTPWPTVLS